MPVKLTKPRYEVIAWDGFAEWLISNFYLRKYAKQTKRAMKPDFAKVKIWDREKHAFIR